MFCLHFNFYLKVNPLELSSNYAATLRALTNILYQISAILASLVSGHVIQNYVR